jgi:hypothetical protein
MKMTETIWVYNAKPENVRELIKRAGNTIGSVHFLKRKDGTLRKMSYRLHVKNPSVAKAPNGVVNQVIDGVDTEDTTIPLTDANLVSGIRPDGSKYIVVNPGPVGYGFGPSRKDVDLANDQMTVLDANKVVKDKSGVAIGRGAWRTIPLETVLQVTVKGVKYVIKK